MINTYSTIHILIFNRFLFVNLNIRYLCSQPSARDILTELDRLQTAQKTDKSTDKLMDPTYDRILEAIRSQPDASASRAIRVLACLVTAQRILTIKELQIAVSLNADMTELDTLNIPNEVKLIDFCFGLVVVDDITKTVRLAHFTSQEYLNRKKIISQNSDTTLAIACTTYLSFDEFKDHRCPKCNGYGNRCDTHHFFKYAVACLSFHLNISDQEGTVGVFRRFLTNEENVLTYYNALRRHSRLVRVPAQRICLLDASAIGHVVMVKNLLETGSDISTTDQDLLTPLHLASHNGHLSLVELLLVQGAKLHGVDKWKNTPLHSAAECGRTEVACLLLDRGANATLANNDMNTPLHIAARLGHLNLIEPLIEKGANLHAENKWKDIPLHDAAKNGHTEVVRLLIKRGSDVKWVNDKMLTPLHLASDNGHPTTVQLLLENRTESGVNLNAVDKSKFTPLHYAAKNGHTEVARLLLESDADFRLGNDDMCTPLHLATLNYHPKTVTLLLQTGSDPNSGIKGTLHPFISLLYIIDRQR
jgi:ankyrin repeat protein